MVLEDLVLGLLDRLEALLVPHGCFLDEAVALPQKPPVALEDPEEVHWGELHDHVVLLSELLGSLQRLLVDSHHAPEHFGLSLAVLSGLWFRQLVEVLLVGGLGQPLLQLRLRLLLQEADSEVFKLCRSQIPHEENLGVVQQLGVPGDLLLEVASGRRVLQDQVEVEANAVQEDPVELSLEMWPLL